MWWAALYDWGAQVGLVCVFLLSLKSLSYYIPEFRECVGSTQNLSSLLSCKFRRTWSTSEQATAILKLEPSSIRLRAQLTVQYGALFLLYLLYSQTKYAGPRGQNLMLMKWTFIVSSVFVASVEQCMAPTYTFGRLRKKRRLHTTIKMAFIQSSCLRLQVLCWCSNT